MIGCTMWLARIKCRLYRMENAVDRQGAVSEEVHHVD